MNKKLKLEELNRIDVETFKKIDKTPIKIILDDIRSMNNVGSIFRTSDAFLVEEIILCGITPKPPHRDIQKTALGATESVNWNHENNVLDVVNRLKEEGYTCLAAEQTQQSISLESYDVSNNAKYAIFFGNEVSGVKQEIIDLCEKSIEIPQFGSKHSFNVSISVSIILWDFFKKIKWA